MRVLGSGRKSRMVGLLASGAEVKAPRAFRDVDPNDQTPVEEVQHNVNLWLEVLRFRSRVNLLSSNTETEITSETRVEEEASHGR